ncbi:ankyrin [Piromyces finnis]|uniref:Ankyrin n=1 Tax=Piromyces finnis TaxID=1754191 RepID=A0A1Y1UXG4_9FUNG|nr:ankyrin [Piromyces finnis]|eukprot:ORX42345.1 ankyrin [Piromyces finnis]
MVDLEKKRNEIEIIISKCRHNELDYINEFENFSINNDLKLSELNNKNFDVLIKVIDSIKEYKVENNLYYFKLIDYIIQECKYQTLNYTNWNNNVAEVPLFLAIYKGFFKIANLLIERGANINYLIEQPQQQETVNIIQYIKKKKDRYRYENTVSNIIIRELGQDTINNKTFNYIFSVGFNIERNIENLISDLLTTYNYDKLENLFKNYVFDNKFILYLLSSYKNNLKISKQNFEKIIEKERTKLKIDGSIYNIAAHCYNSFPVGILLDYDGDNSNIIFDKMVNNNILEIATINNNKNVINKILDLDTFNIRKIDYEYFFKKSCYKRRFDFTNSINYVYQAIQCKLKPSFSFIFIMNNVIVYASKAYKYNYINRNTVRLYIDILYHRILDILTSTVDGCMNKNFYSKVLLNMLNLSIKINDLKYVKNIVENRIMKPYLDMYDKDDNEEYPLFTAYTNYIERNEPPHERININTEIIKYLLEHGDSQSKEKKYIDKAIFFMALEDKECIIMQYILKSKEFPNNINFDFNDIYKGFQPLKVIPPSIIDELIYLADIPQEVAMNDDIFSNPIFISILHNYVKDHIVNDDDMELYTNLLKAVYDDDVNQVEKIVKNLSYPKNNINVLDRIVNSFTPLTFSYLFNRLNCFEVLLQYCDISNLDGNHHLLLHYAILKKDIKMIERLLCKNIHLYPEQYKSVIALSIEIGYKDILFILLDYHKPNIELNEFQFMAILSSQLTLPEKKEIITYLLQKGANINYMENNGGSIISPLRCAVELSNKNQDISLIKYLIENGAVIEESFESKEDLLFGAVYEQNLPLISYLVELGVNINYIEEERCALSVAIEMSSVPITKLLIEHNANVHQIITDNMGKKKSLLMYAIEMGEENIIKLLMQYHARIEYYDKSDSYKLIKAIKNESFNLLDYIRQQEFNFETPRLIKNIISDGRLDLIHDLVEYKLLDINIKDDQGETPIFYAIKYSEERILNYLIQCGADLSIKNKNGETIETVYRWYNDAFFHHSKLHHGFKQFKIEK